MVVKELTALGGPGGVAPPWLVVGGSPLGAALCSPAGG